MIWQKKKNVNQSYGGQPRKGRGQFDSICLWNEKHHSACHTEFILINYLMRIHTHILIGSPYFCIHVNGEVSDQNNFDQIAEQF